MSLQQANHQQHLYQAESHMGPTLQSVRDRFSQICKQHANRHVRVETMDGDVFEGMIVGCNKGILYIQMPMENANGQRYLGRPPVYNAILPLVLYELLVITLLM
ncbi:hypothetical protein [Paenibacillus chibensis]|uniref:hypothetical protein n=1 Tax=Paenibacillus chibensis TaxID=59846 RepID=UPI000FDC6561|nr:hypothetical protein [Paenibacillus chibensis]MEC0371694.1 hypothetical protein [Paenibacillus chibensis]